MYIFRGYKGRKRKNRDGEGKIEMEKEKRDGGRKNMDQ